jgi:hypothetical protein
MKKPRPAGNSARGGDIVRDKPPGASRPTARDPYNSFINAPPNPARPNTAAAQADERRNGIEQLEAEQAKAFRKAGPALSKHERKRQRREWARLAAAAAAEEEEEEEEEEEVFQRKGELPRQLAEEVEERERQAGLQRKAELQRAMAERKRLEEEQFTYRAEGAKSLLSAGTRTQGNETKEPDFYYSRRQLQREREASAAELARQQRELFESAGPGRKKKERMERTASRADVKPDVANPVVNSWGPEILTNNKAEADSDVDLFGSSDESDDASSSGDVTLDINELQYETPQQRQARIREAERRQRELFLRS